jgi:hypothetical protein
MFFVQHDDVVQAFPAEGTDKAFDHWILPRARGAMSFCSRPRFLTRHTKSAP